MIHEKENRSSPPFLGPAGKLTSVPFWDALKEGDIPDPNAAGSADPPNSASVALEPVGTPDTVPDPP